MARTLQTPSINKIIPVDPNYDFEVVFQYNDSQAVKNRAVITDTETYNVVYDQEQLGMRLGHIVPANTLTAGKRYVVQIQVFDEDGNSSLLSEQMPFYCYTTPVFKISNLENDAIIKNASVTAMVEYIQAEGETIANLKINLYDQSMVQVDSSPMFYNYPADNNYTFYSLANNGAYYVQAVGETVHGIAVETELIRFTVVYAKIPANAIFTVENVYNQGYINVVSNINDIGYKAEGCSLQDGVLTIENGYLLYNEGFELDGNGYYRIAMTSLPLGKFFTTNEDRFYISFVEISGDYYFWLVSGDYHLFRKLDYVTAGATYEKDGIVTTLYNLTNYGMLYLEIIEQGGVYDMRITYN